MKVSVIIPYVNERIYRDDCMNSLQEQSCRDFEAVVICDGAGGAEDFADWKEKATFPLTVLTMTDKSGVAAARNTGVDHSRGEYVLFLDIDDYLERTALEDMLACASTGTDLIRAGLRETWYGRNIYYDNGQRLDEQNAGWKDVQWAAEMEYTVLGYLLRREYLLRHGISFDETFRYCADLPYVAQILGSGAVCAETDRILYLKRRRNDPVRLPSLRQIPDHRRKGLEILRAYRCMKQHLAGEDEITLDRRMICCYLDSIAPWYGTADAADAEKMHHEAVECLSLLCPEAVRAAGAGPRRRLRYAGTHTAQQMAGRLRTREEIRMLARALTSRAACKKYLYRRLFMRMRLREDLVVFESFLGRSYSDSPKYIFEFLNQSMPGRYRYVWILNKKQRLPYPAKCIRRYGFRYFYYIAVAKYFVFNSRQSRDHRKRDGSVFLETWHGTPLKKLVFDMGEVTASAPLYKRDVYQQARDWDYLIAPNHFCSQIFRRCFQYGGKLLETGYPRNDILHLREDIRRQKEKQVRESLGISSDKKVILYAPTWRDDEFYAQGKHSFTLNLDLEKLQEGLGMEYVLLLRMHYFVASRLTLTEKLRGFVFDVSGYDDIAELYLISDILVTDYSSVFFDYANLRRPMLFFTYDLEKYRDVLRGFYIDLEEELPGPMLFSTGEVLDAVRRLPQIEAEYRERYKLFYDKYCGWEDGAASQRVAEAVFGRR